MQDNIKIITSIKKDYKLNLVRALCDLAICLNENDLPRIIFGIRINQGVQGIFGVISAFIYLISLA